MIRFISVTTTITAPIYILRRSIAVVVFNQMRYTNTNGPCGSNHTNQFKQIHLRSFFVFLFKKTKKKNKKIK